MSHIEGIEQLKRAFRSFEDQVAVDISAGIVAETEEMQRETASLVGVDSGDGRDALLDPSALRIVKSPDGVGTRVVFGLDIKALAKRAFHLFFLEFGSKAYFRGERRYWNDRKGRRRSKKVKRTVPARPAYPFWRPAEANLWRRLERRLNMGRIVAAAKLAAGSGRGGS